MKYELKTYTSDKNKGQFNMSFVIGLCTFSMCQDDSLTAFDTFYIQTATQTLKENFNAQKSMNVLNRLDSIREDRNPGFWVMISIFTTALILSVIGIVV